MFSIHLKQHKCAKDSCLVSLFCQGTVLIRNAEELKSFSRGEEEQLEKVSA